MRILGIETSCDETAAAIIEVSEDDKKGKLLSNVVVSSLSLHSKTGGIVPEVAAREQLKYIIPVIEKALNKLKVENGKLKINSQLSTLNSQLIPPIDAIAVTVGPGLIGSLLVGVETAKTLAYVWQKPIIPVNHLIGHIYANFVGEISNLKSQISNKSNPEFPLIALIVSGGHTDLVLMKEHQKIKWIGGTRDDAAGEALDKIGRLLGLPYPGGPSIEKASECGDASHFTFPRPMIDSNDLDFSFSGLKTAVLREIQGVRTYSSSDQAKPESREVSSDKFSTSSNNKIIADIAASVQQAIIDVLISKTLKAAQKYKVRSILLGGGVAANQKLRDQLKLAARRYKLNANIFAPQKFLCTDNAAMIATAALFDYKPIHWSKVTANPELYFD